MAKQRIINTRFWDDSYIVSLTPNEKLLFLYLLTNPLTNIAGVYELPLRRVAFDIASSERETRTTLQKFQHDGKVVMADGWIGIVNFIRYQTLNPKVKLGIVSELKKAPKSLVDSLSIDYQALSIADESLSHLNLNSNINSNVQIDSLSAGKLSTERKREFKNQKDALVTKWRIY